MIIIMIFLLITSATLVLVLLRNGFLSDKESISSKLKETYFETALANKALHDLTRDTFVAMVDFVQKQNSKYNRTQKEQGEKND